MGKNSARMVDGTRLKAACNLYYRFSMTCPATAPGRVTAVAAAVLRLHWHDVGSAPFVWAAETGIGGRTSPEERIQRRCSQ